MNDSIILRSATRFLYPILIMLSLIVLYRGHNLPGGGFIGGLVAAAAVMLRALALGWGDVMASKWLRPLALMQYGLILSSSSAFVGLIFGQAFFQALWLPTWYAPVIGKVKLGTPTLFDVGVYMVVLGFSVLCAESLDKNKGEGER